MINVDIKQKGETGIKALETVIGLMDRLETGYRTYDRVVLASFHSEVYKRLKEYHKIKPNLLFSPNHSGIITLYATYWARLDFMYNEPVALFQIPVKLGPLSLNRRYFINAAHRHNIAVHYWTINDEKTMRDLINKGADGIITGMPTLLKHVLDDMIPVDN
jgi:glycerophosphoryl diester phosphodiesterase